MPHPASSFRQRGSNPIFTAAVHKDSLPTSEQRTANPSRGPVRTALHGGAHPHRHIRRGEGIPGAAGENSSRIRPKRGGRHHGDGGRHGADRIRGKIGAGGRHGRRNERQRGGRMTERPSKEKSTLGIPAPLKNAVRVITLGGVEEIGKNITAFEIGNDIIIVDCGFQFSKEETPGIDYILPNTRYLEERKEKIRAVVITHGHLDHIGGIPYILPKLGNPPVYMRNLTMLMIKKRQEEFPHVPPLELRVVLKTARIKAGELFLRFFEVTHTIPDSMGIVIETPCGDIVHTGDLKLDHRDGIPEEHEETEFGQFRKRNTLLLLSDSTNVERPGFSIPEKTVFKNIDEIVKNAKGRLIIGTFASQIERISRIIEIAEKHKKKVVVDGYSMKTNIEIARTAGVLSPQKDTIIPLQEMDKYPPEKIVALVTGAQGDEFAVLMRLANKSHRNLKIVKGDTVVLSSSIIPGNELPVQKLKDNLSRQGATIVHYQVSDVHSSGHANRGELLWFLGKIKPKFFIPIHGYHYMLRVHTELAKEAGVPEDNIIIPDNGMIIDIIDGTKIEARKESAGHGLVLVDGFSIGDIQEVVIRDRQMLAQDGMFVLVVTIDVNTGKLRKSPDLISRGFVYLRESQKLLATARELIKTTVESNTAGMYPINFDYLKGILTDKVSQYLFQETNKRPIVIPVILGI